VNPQVCIIEPLGERAAQLPLELGGAGATLAVPGVAGVVLTLEASGGQWRARPADGAGIALNGVALHAAQPLAVRPGIDKGESGDVLAGFGEQLKQRFGSLERVSIASQSNSGSLLAPTIETACVFVFESTQRTGSAAFQLAITGKSIWPELRLTRLVVDDGESGSLAFPAEIR
jgi:hypothetical protein